MRVNEGIPGRPKTFDEILDQVRACKPLAPRVIKTMLVYGYLTDGILFSLLEPKERQAIQHLDGLYSGGSSEYKGSLPFDVNSALPEFLGPAVETADYVGKINKDSKQELVLLQGYGREHLVDVRSFVTLTSRHPTAEWYFARGRGYGERPLVLLEPLGFRRGTLLGALSPVKIEGWERPCPPPSEGGWERVIEKNGTMRYVEVV